MVSESLPPFSPLTLGSGETAFLGLEIVVAPDMCDNYVPGGFIIWDSVSLRYSYARSFERETTIRLPTRIALVC